MKKILVITYLLIAMVTVHGQSYLGFFNKTANLREGPGKEFNILLTLNAGSKIFIISLDEENEFLNVIDIESGTEGFVHRDFAKAEDVIYTSPGSIFSATGKIDDENPVLTVKNNTSKILTLKLNKLVFTFRAGETRAISIPPGSYRVIASAPRVIPMTGTDRMEKNLSYRWSFYLKDE